MNVFVFLSSLSVVSCQYLGTGDYQYVGCFRDNHRDRDLGTRALDLPRVNVSSCVTWCKEHYYKYAGLQQAGAGASCWCGPEFGKHGPGTCSDTCPGDTEHTCGGEETNSVYRTGVKVPGPPGSVMVTGETEDSLTVGWAAPESPNGEVTNYRVVISPGQSYNKHRARVTDKVINMDGADRMARVGDLLSGTQYTVTVSAVNRAGEAGPGVDTQTWTRVGAPDTPPPPEVIRWDKRRGLIRVRVSPVENNGGEVRHYQVIVAEGQHPSLNNVPLLGYKEAEAEGHGYWISAQITPQYLASRNGEISLGDGQLYGGYLNHGPLDSGLGYQLAVAVTQSLHGESRVSVSDLVTSDPGAGDSLVLRVSGEGGDQYRVETRQPVNGQHSPSSPRVNIGLVVGVVVAGVLLAGAVIVFLVLRRRAGPGSPLRRARSDTLALSQQQQQQQHNSSAVSTSAVGVTAASYVHDNDEILASETPDLNIIKSKVWMIPKNFVELSGEVLGKGRFGSVTKGQVHNNGRVIWVNTQHVYLSSLTRGDAAELTRALSASVQAGSHPNITGLVGLCEEQEVLTVVMDQAQPSLKQHLLDSRALVTAPVESHTPTWPMPKIFRMVKKGKVDKALFEGSTINTPSLLATEDYLDALKWARANGGYDGLVKRADANLAAIERFVEANDWISFLSGPDKSVRSNTSVCLSLADVDADGVKKMASLLESNQVALDIGAYRSAPPGFRIWCGPTVETKDVEAMLPWLSWARDEVKK